MERGNAHFYSSHAEHGYQNRDNRRITMLRLRHWGLTCSLLLIPGASTALAQVDCTGAPQWDLPTAYNIGDRVLFESRLIERGATAPNGGGLDHRFVHSRPTM